MSFQALTSDFTLPEDADTAALVGRVWLPQENGPAVVRIERGEVVDISRTFPTVSALCEEPDPASALRAATGRSLGSLDALLAATRPDARDGNAPFILAPVDLQAVKATGVTFVVSMLERVIEERSRGSAEEAVKFRDEINELIGSDISALKPGSPEAAELKDILIARGAWSQYLEVAIGPDAEVFTKAQPLSAVGTGAYAGLHPRSRWNNSEPEVVLAISSQAKIVGVTLGNDVNLRDFEGRSALLLGRAKDNNASCAMGPFLRLFDADFTLDDVRAMDISLEVRGEDGFTLEGVSSISKISRDPEDLVSQLIGPHHQYADGAVFFLGTMFAPTQDRDRPGEGFTHKYGDRVTISTPRLGRLVNVMQASDACPHWQFGTRALMHNLHQRGLLG